MHTVDLKIWGGTVTVRCRHGETHRGRERECLGLPEKRVDTGQVKEKELRINTGVKKEKVHVTKQR